MSTHVHLDHDKVKQAIGAFGQFATATGHPEVMTEIQPSIDKYTAGLFKLVVIGEEKRGKSSFVGALLGRRNLVPVGTEPMTSVVYKIIYGPQTKYRVHFLSRDAEDPTGSRPAPREVDEAGVADYGTEAGNPGNARGVDFIAVEHPHSLLAAGLVIVDLPGLGGLKQEHALITRRYLPNADASFFVVDSTSGPLTRQEIETFQLLAKFVGQMNILMIQTKIDAVDSGQWQGWRNRNLQIMEERLGVAQGELPYFPVSNTDKYRADETSSADDLEDSGFGPLLQLLSEELLPGSRDQLARPAIELIVKGVASLAEPLHERIAILSTTSKESLQLIARQLEQARSRYSQWQEDELPDILARFNLEFDQAYRESHSALQAHLDPSPHAELVGRIMEAMEQGCATAQAVVENAPAAHDKAVTACAEILSRVSAEFERCVTESYQEAADAIGKALTPLVAQEPNPSGPLTFRGMTPRLQTNSMQTASQVRMGAGLGAATAGLVAALFFPPLGLAVAVISAIGAIFGGRRGLEEARARERKQALQQMENLLQDTVRRVRDRATTDFKRTADDTSQQMRSRLDGAIKRKNKDDRAAIEALSAQQRDNQAESAAQLKAERAKLALAEGVTTALREAGVALD